METKIIYDNRTFTLGTAGRYFFAKIKGKDWSLHRYKYTKEKGPIPDKWHVHHIDGNHFNNDISNLVAIAPIDHSKLHPVPKERTEKWQKAGIKAAHKWHSSPEGKKWHKDQYENNLKNKLHALHDRKCDNCGKEFKSKRKQEQTFCSNSCKTRFRFKSGVDNISRKCNFCGKDFVVNKYVKIQYCSIRCGGEARKKINRQ